MSRKLSLNESLRPKSFDDFIGNATALKSLKMILSEGRQRAFLLHGPRGTGKTSLSRVMSQYLKGGDVITVNCGLNNGVESVERIVSDASWGSLKKGSKIIILEEVNALTKKFQNSILTTLEEPKADVYLILLTTEPQNLSDALVSRCYSYKTKALAFPESMSFIEVVCEKAEIELGSVVKKLVSQKALGCPRDLIALVDMVKGLSEEEAVELLDDVVSGEAEESGELKEFVTALLYEKERGEVAKALTGVMGSGMAAESIRRATLAWCGKVALNGKPKQQGRALQIIENFSTNLYDTGDAGLIYMALSIS
jgi:DNA polymerase III gamma/tau subunit